ncbi:MAG: FecR family protein [Mariprofundales bacterium]|nr:FecR family protein [Mariprofundales bacterium]
MRYLSRTLAAVFFLLLTFTLAPSAWAAGNQVMVTRLAGSAQAKATSSSPWRTIAVGSGIDEGGTVRLPPSRRGRIELTLPDHSVVRLRAPAQIQLNQFVPGNHYDVRMHLIAGHAWSSVRKMIHSRHSHHLYAGTAVMGVRGTQFDTVVSDKSGVDLRLFDGSVGIAPQADADRVDHAPATVTRTPHAPREITGPKEISPPKEISMHNWLVVLKSMQRIHIGVNGQPGKTINMNLKQEQQDKWIAWNLHQDKIGSGRSPP